MRGILGVTNAGWQSYKYICIRVCNKVIRMSNKVYIILLLRFVVTFSLFTASMILKIYSIYYIGCIWLYFVLKVLPTSIYLTHLTHMY